MLIRQSDFYGSPRDSLYSVRVNKKATIYTAVNSKKRISSCSMGFGDREREKELPCRGKGRPLREHKNPRKNLLTIYWRFTYAFLGIALNDYNKLLAGAGGFEPPNAGSKDPCLAA